MAQNIAAVIPQAKAQLEIQTRPIPTPGPGELVIRNHAVAANPVDYTVQANDIFINRYPNVLGSDVCGVVESVGPDVTMFQKGDRVLGFSLVLAEPQNIDEGGFQTYTLLREQATAKLPDGVSFEQGTTFPMGMATASSGLFAQGGELKLPPVDGKAEKPYVGHGFAVWGAASAVGVMTMQIAKDLGFTVYATASPHHHTYLEGLGATKVWDYKDSDVVAKVVQAAKANGTPITFGYDAVCLDDSSIKVAEMIAQTSDKGGRMAYTRLLPEGKEIPKGVDTVACLAFALFTQTEKIARYLFHEYLPVAIEQGRLKPAPEVEVVPGGIPATQKLWDQLKAGVSGKKLIIQVE